MNKHYLSPDVLLRQIEEPSVYHIRNDELYELDEKGFNFLHDCAAGGGCLSNEKEFISYCISEGILTDSPQVARRQFIRKSPLPSLRYLELLLTDRCNLRCRHCYIGEPLARELPLEQVVRLLEEFFRMQGLRVLLSGGEPLLYSEFERLNEYLGEYPLRKVLLTNGMLISEERLMSLNVEEVQISIDGLESSHDAIRGVGSYRKAIDGIRLSLNAGLDVSVSTMVHPGNLNDFEEMEELFHFIGVSEWTVDVPCTSGRMGENTDLFLPPEIAGRYLGYGYGGGFHGGGVGFGCGLHLVSILPDGYVAKCAFYADRAVGHISEGLERCWKRIRPVELISLACDCEEIEACRGGCRYRAELLGDPMGKDLYKCHAFLKRESIR